MKDSSKKIGLFAGLFTLFFVANAFAAEAATWRLTYDFIMRWFNFAIIVALVAKYGWGPLTRWLKGQGDEVARQLEAMEQKKQTILDKMAETKGQIEQRAKYLDDLMTRTTEAAIRDKEAIIEQAKLEGAQLVKDAKRRAEYQIAEARNNFRGELIDEAVVLASEKLPGIISQDDEVRIQEDFLVKAMK